MSGFEGIKIMVDRHGLSDRELEVLALVSRGLTSRQIAEDLNLSAFTVNNHRKNICRKLGVHSTAELVVRGIRLTDEVAAERNRAAGDRQRHVLVVDDDPAFISGICELLSSAGYNVLAARDAAEALSVLEQRSHDIDLAVVDLVLPGSFSGFDVIGRLSRIPNRMKIVAVSGVLRGPDLYVAGRVGAHAVFEKPLPGAEWLQTVGDLLAA